MFEDSNDAIRAALDTRAALKEYNSKQKKKNILDVTGFGIHTGELLFIDGTDIHWGDPVNTSSKLGQDTATDQDILVTKEVYDRLKNKGRDLF